MCNFRNYFFCLSAMFASFFTTTCMGTDVVWNEITYDDQTVSEMITIIISTSPIVSNPSTKCIQEAHASLFRIPAFAKCKKIIVFDEVWPSDRFSTRHEKYDQFKQNMIELAETDPLFKNTELVFCPEWGHLSGTVKEALKYVETPYIFLHQHDLILQKDFDLNGLVASMVANPKIKYVTLWNSSNFESEWYNYLVDDKVEGIHFVPLSRSFGFTDQCHVAAVSYYTDFILPQCDYTFMEGVINHKYRREVLEQGLSVHETYGTYLYGDLFDGEYIFHLDGRTYSADQEE